MFTFKIQNIKEILYLAQNILELNKALDSSFGRLAGRDPPPQSRVHGSQLARETKAEAFG
jgi:hypothetical protein